MSPLLLLHFGAGTVGLLSGAAALGLRKGSSSHRLAVKVFAPAMLTMSTLDAYLALVKGQTINVMVGLLMFYLSLSAWRTISRRDGMPPAGLDWLAYPFALAIGAFGLSYGLTASFSDANATNGRGAYLFFGCIALLGAGGDLRVLIGNGIHGQARTRRHLWRLCFAMLISTVSLFLGQAQVFPEPIRKSGVLFVPPLLVLGILIYWLCRFVYKAIRVRAVRGSEARRLPHTVAKLGFG